MPLSNKAVKKLFNKAKFKKQLAALSETFLELNYMGGAEEAAGAASMSLVPDFVERPEVARYVRTHSMKFAASVSNETERHLKNTISQGLSRGEPMASIKKRVGKVFTAYKKSHCELIARTETTRAYTGGFREVGAMSSVVVGYTWNAAGDSCPFCAELDGQHIKGDASFFELGEHMTVDGSTLKFDYDRVEGPPLHPSCRCSLLAVTRDVQSTPKVPEAFKQ